MFCSFAAQLTEIAKRTVVMYISRPARALVRQGEICTWMVQVKRKEPI